MGFTIYGLGLAHYFDYKRNNLNPNFGWKIRFENFGVFGRSFGRKLVFIIIFYTRKSR
jgi:hypothetical protein